MASCAVTGWWLYCKAAYVAHFTVTSGYDKLATVSSCAAGGWMVLVRLLLWHTLLCSLEAVMTSRVYSGLAGL